MAVTLQCGYDGDEYKGVAILGQMRCLQNTSPPRHQHSQPDSLKSLVHVLECPLPPSSPQILSIHQVFEPIEQD